jgi:nicotinamide-nucleotide amidase
LTRQAMAEAFDLPLELNEQSLATIQNMFSSRGREMPERNRVQAMFPQGSSPIPNPNGTAPGVDLTIGTNESKCRILSLPGVPAEMKEMWQETVRPALLKQLGDDAQVVRHFRLKCFGTGESALEAMLPDLIRRGREPAVGITVSKATITLRVTARGKDDDACWDLIQPTVDTIRKCLGDLVFGEEDDELQHAVARMLLHRNETLAVAEWGSGGLLADWLSAIPASADAFKGAKIVSSHNSASRMLDVDRTLDPPTHAKELAIAVRERCDASYGISLGAFPADPNDPEAKVFIGLASESDASVSGRRFAGHPDILKERAAKQALDVLRLHLLKTQT